MRVNANGQVQGVTGVSANVKATSTPRLSPDEASVSGVTALHEALEQTPVVRADKVAQAKALVANPNYPGDTLINQVAGVLAKGLKTQG